MEPRRIPPNNISSSFSGTAMAAASLRLGGGDFAEEQTLLEKPSSLDQKGQSGSKGSTVRFELDLFQPDSIKYPEFNYKRLLHVEKKKTKIIKQKLNANNNGPASDPFEENDDDVARIAKKMEERYGTGYVTSRGRSKKSEQDIGQGYDDNDSFIDNTEAYDEVVPEEVETIEGGFYINCGALEYKKLNTPPKTRTDEIIKVPNRLMKRILSTSSEGSSSSSDEGEEDIDDENDDEKDDEDDETGEEADLELEYKVSSGASCSSKADKCAKTAATPADVSGMLVNGNTHKKQKHNDAKCNKDVIKKDSAGKSQQVSCSSSNSPKPSIDDGIGSEDSEKERRQKVVSVKDVVLQAKRDKFFKMQVDGEIKGAAAKSSDDDTDSSSSSDDNSESDGDESQAPSTDKKMEPKKVKETFEKVRTIDIKLPQEMDASVLVDVDAFMKKLREKNINSKKFMFDDELTMIFLKLDDQLSLEKPQRNIIYSHMEVQLSLQKSFFLRKAKQLRIRVEKQKNKRILTKLRRAIANAMPLVIANYEKELRKYADSQSSSLLGSDDPPLLPRKIFPWDEEFRSILLDVYQTYWSSFSVLGTPRKHTREEYMQSYVKSQIVTLWPNGWMRYEELQREVERYKAASKKIKERKKGTASPVATDLTVNKVAATSTAKSTCSNSEAAAESFKSATTCTSSSQANTYRNEPTLVNGTGISLLKRKAPADGSIKQNKSKTIKSNMMTEKYDTKSVISMKNEDSKSYPYANMQPSKIDYSNNKKNQQDCSMSTIMLDSRRSDHSIHSIMSAQAALTTNALLHSSVYTTATATAAATLTQPQVAQSQAHSSAVTASNLINCLQTHVIDVEKYSSPSDILLTSQKLQATAAAATAINKTERVRSSSNSDSEVVFVREFPLSRPNEKDTLNKNKNKKNAHLSNSCVPNDITVTMTTMNMNQMPKSNAPTSINAAPTGMYSSGSSSGGCNINNNYMKNNKKLSNYNSADITVDLCGPLQATKDRQRQEKNDFSAKESMSQQ